MIAPAWRTLEAFAWSESFVSSSGRGVRIWITVPVFEAVNGVFFHNNPGVVPIRFTSRIDDARPAAMIWVGTVSGIRFTQQ